MQERKFEREKEERMNEVMRTGKAIRPGFKREDHFWGGPVQITRNKDGWLRGGGGDFVSVPSFFRFRFFNTASAP